MRDFSETSLIMRQAIDEVIDSANTGRNAVEELEAPEIAYLATKVEILLKYWLSFPRGNHLDVLIAGEETGVKCAIESRCSIATTILGHPCVVVRIDLTNSRFSIGIVVPRSTRLSLGGVGRQAFRSLKLRQPSVHWICRNCAVPRLAGNRIGEQTRFTRFSESTFRPQDPDKMNDTRAIWALDVLGFFEQFGESPAPGSTREENRSISKQNLGDLIADLAHFCDRAGIQLYPSRQRQG